MLYSLDNFHVLILEFFMINRMGLGFHEVNGTIAKPRTFLTLSVLSATTFKNVLSGVHFD